MSHHHGFHRRAIAALGAGPLLLLIASIAHGDPPLPGNLLDPQSAPEAWNAIRLSTSNVQRLIDENRVTEIPEQIAFCSPALRALPRFLTAPDAAAEVRAAGTRALTWVNALAREAAQKNAGGVSESFERLREQLKIMSRHFPENAVNAQIHFCPMHPDFISEKPATPCAKCGMSLLERRIPYSFIYMKPGKPTVHIALEPEGAVVANREMKVKVRLSMKASDAGPATRAVTPDDLLVMHTQPIHLLIQEPGLADYHHEHPAATTTPGEYVFSFIPKKSSPYRIWADVVPAATGIQELPFADLPSEGPAGSLKDRSSTFTSVADGLAFSLELAGGNARPPVAGQARGMTITVSEPDGKPVTRLAPVMNAFAHMVGFYEDYATVVHFHPTGGDILNADLRGGPVMGFKFFPPKAGFMRLYCQVSVDGRMIFAPFNVNIEAAP